MAIFKVGDFVTLREDLELNYWYGNEFEPCCAIKEIVEKGGLTFKIDGVDDNENYHLAGFDEYNYVNIEMIELSEDQRIALRESDYFKVIDFLTNEKINRENAIKTNYGYSTEETLEEKGYSKCPECGNYEKIDTILKEEFGGLCNNCLSKKVSGTIERYHATQDWRVHLTGDNDIPVNMGFELEVEGNRGNLVLKEADAYSFKEQMNELVVIERDGSLSEDGFEIITQPMSINYFEEKEELFRNAMSNLIKKGYRSHNTDSCGLHVHVDRGSLGNSERERERTIDNILLIVESFREPLENFARRNNNSYASFVTRGGEKEKLSLKKIKKQKRDAWGDRYRAVNITKGSTIEFRLFRGTLKYETLAASLELVLNIVRIAKEGNVNGLTWSDIVNYDANRKYLMAYCQERNITSSVEVSLLSYFELHKDFFSKDNFLKGLYLVNFNNISYRDYKVGMFSGLLSKDINMEDIEEVFRHISNSWDTSYQRIICLNGKLGFKTVDETEEYDNEVDLDDLIGLWLE